MTLSLPLAAGEVAAVPVAGRDIADGPAIDVCSPYDGSRLGGVPRLGAGHVSEAVAYARHHFRAEPLPPWQRAEILERAARRLVRAREEFARIIAHEAAKPIRTARVEADRAGQIPELIGTSMIGEDRDTIDGKGAAGE